MIRAAQQFGAHCVGVTLSENQAKLARERVAAAGLCKLITIRLQDYRDVEGQFDRVTSVGMFEHVGLKNLPLYFKKINALLKDDGLAMNHGITTTFTDHRNAPWGGGEFIEKYVFPHGELPHIGHVLTTMQEGGLEALDVENMRRHYAQTCALWADNFERNTSHIRSLVDEKRYRSGAFIWPAARTRLPTIGFRSIRSSAAKPGGTPVRCANHAPTCIGKAVPPSTLATQFVAK